MKLGFTSFFLAISFVAALPVQARVIEDASESQARSLGFQLLGTTGMVLTTGFLLLLMAAIWRSRHAFEATARE